MKYKVNLPVKIMYFTGAAKLYHYGSYSSGVGFVNGLFRRWHPITWLLFIGLLIPCTFSGIKIASAIPFDMLEYYKRPENLKWVTWKDFI
jgi:hypothetical protein